jgi:hypothetical protein
VTDSLSATYLFNDSCLSVDLSIGRVASLKPAIALIRKTGCVSTENYCARNESDGSKLSMLSSSSQRMSP